MSWTAVDHARQLYTDTVINDVITGHAPDVDEQRYIAVKCFELAATFAVEASKRDPATGKLKNVGLPTDVDADDGDVSEGEG